MPLRLYQKNFRFRYDDGSESAATWMATEGTNVSVAQGTPFRLRILMDEDGGSDSAGEYWNLRVSKNNGTYIQIGNGQPIHFIDSTYLTDGLNVTQQLSGGTGSFTISNDGQADYNAPMCSVLANNYIEFEWCLKINGTFAAAGDTLDFRIYRGTTALYNYTVTPRVTVTAGHTSATDPNATMFITHEHGNLNEWTSPGNNCTAQATAALAGSAYGLQVQPSGTNAYYCQKDMTQIAVPLSGQFRGRFYFSTAALTMTDATAFRMFYLINQASSVVIGFRLYYATATGYQIIPAYNTDSLIYTEIAGTNISNGSHYLEYAVERASSTGVYDGTVTFWCDGTQIGQLTGLDNDSLCSNFRYFRVGLVANISTGVTGYLRIDECVHNKDGKPIGAMDGQHVFNSKPAFLQGPTGTDAKDNQIAYVNGATTPAPVMVDDNTSTSTFSIEPSIMQTSGGNLYIVCEHTSLNLYIWKSINGGDSWSLIITEATSTIWGATCNCADISAQIDSTDTIHVAVSPQSAGAARTHRYRSFNTSNDTWNGSWESFGSSITQVETECQLEIDENDKPHVLFVQVDTGGDANGPYRVFYTNRISGSWLTPEQVSTTETGWTDDSQWLSLLVKDANNIEAMYHDVTSSFIVYYRTRTNGSWGSENTFTTDGHTPYSIRKYGIVNDSGTIRRFMFCINLDFDDNGTWVDWPDFVNPLALFIYQDKLTCLYSGAETPYPWHYRVKDGGTWSPQKDLSAFCYTSNVGVIHNQRNGVINTKGHFAYHDTADLYYARISDTLTAKDNQPCYLTGPIVYNTLDNQNAFTQGNSTTLDNQLAFTQGGTTGLSNKPCYLFGTTEYTTFLDDFNRADGGPGPSWQGSGGASTLRLISNSLRGAELVWGDGYWKALFNQNQEIYAKLAVGTSVIEFTLRWHDFGTAYGSGYFLLCDGASLRFYEFANSIETPLGSAYSVALAAGDKIKATAIGNVLTAWRDTGSGWVRLFSLTDNTHLEGGYIGFQIDGDNGIDDFGGGNLPSVLDSQAVFLQGQTAGTATSDNQISYIHGGLNVNDNQLSYLEGCDPYQPPVGDGDQDADWTDQDLGTTLADDIDDYSPDDSTYAQHADIQVGDFFEVLLDTMPEGIEWQAGDCTLEWRGCLLEGTATVTMKCELYNNTTLVCTDSRTLSLSFTTYSHILSAGEFAMISSDYNNLKLRFEVTAVV